MVVVLEAVVFSTSYYPRVTDFRYSHLGVYTRPCLFLRISPSSVPIDFQAHVLELPGLSTRASIVSVTYVIYQSPGSIVN